jgi:hypothetical protein
MKKFGAALAVLGLLACGGTQDSATESETEIQIGQLGDEPADVAAPYEDEEEEEVVLE